MESNSNYHLFFKYVLLLVGLLLISIPVIWYVFPEQVEINGEVGASQPLAAIVIMELLGVLSIIVFFLVKDKFAIVELSNQTITIRKEGEERTVNWVDVDFITQIQFVQPPLYKLRIRGEEETIWFNTHPIYVSVGGFTSDLSEMGSFIKKKKRELGL
jgi:hypothetical protein